tara:strand:- start:89 stop:247 length:159 start_codon:yes stop_codon:yes gene_type:complete
LANTFWLAALTGLAFLTAQVATPLFGLGVVFVIVSIALYSRPMHVPCIDDDS